MMNRIPRFATHAFKLFVMHLNNHKWHSYARSGKFIPVYGFLWYFTKKEQPATNNKIINKIITQADELFEDEKYLVAYNLLCSYHKEKNVEIDWRICRALYKLSREDTYDKETKHAMILEAFDVINEALKKNENNAECHKWMAILLDAKLRFETSFSKIEDNFRIKNHLLEANKLNPNDFTVLYMLGQWHYKLCTLTWFQKKFAAFLYHEPLQCNYEDALTYFLKAEELKPRFYISNIYMLGKVNYHMGNLYRAHYYLTIAAQMTPNSEYEEEYVNLAQNLVNKLKNYDISEDAL